ncbi:DUF3631 domain-containing protein [Kordiimonas pumila]|uniref:DUF3631 domain-containing protein n=1 Tax=Kordiimonas pumila TaxID=2161677 RepID=A0ABV7D0P7_9PROT|nr:DUF3631 domain-containing protein [Kordiimonas pumila]
MTDNSTPSLVEDLLPATGTIDIEALLDNIEGFILSHSILPPGASAALTLWCLASYNINNFRIFPKLVICSPQRRCGKSTVLDLIEAFSSKALVTSNMTPATIFRIIESDQPTLIIDEADTFVAGGSKEMIGIINSGHARSRAYANRCAAETHQVQRFSTWAPMALASIGELSSTIMDRAVVITLKRKTARETVLRLVPDLPQKSILDRRKLLKWSLDNEAQISNNLIEPPNIGNDRAVDNWLPLFTIANQVSAVWLDKCEAAYQALTESELQASLEDQLLIDIRLIFVEKAVTRISSQELVFELLADIDSRWHLANNGRAMKAPVVARILRPFRVKSRNLRFGNGTQAKGYELSDFKDTFDRYLEPLVPPLKLP